MLTTDRINKIAAGAAKLQREADIAIILKFAAPYIYHAGGMVGALCEAPLVTDDPKRD